MYCASESWGLMLFNTQFKQTTKFPHLWMNKRQGQRKGPNSCILQEKLQKISAANAHPISSSNGVYRCLKAVLRHTTAQCEKVQNPESLE